MAAQVGVVALMLLAVSAKFGTVRFGYDQEWRDSAYLPDMNERGCDYCRDDQNMKFGHVEQIAASEQRGLLLRCPQCDWLYVDPSDGVTEPTRIDADGAGEWFDLTG